MTSDDACESNTTNYQITKIVKLLTFVML